MTIRKPLNAEIFFSKRTGDSATSTLLDMVKLTLAHKFILLVTNVVIDRLLKHIINCDI